MKHTNKTDRVESIADDLAKKEFEKYKYQQFVNQMTPVINPKKTFWNVLKRIVSTIIFVIGLITIVKFVIGLM